MLRVHSTALIDEMMMMGEKASSGSHSSSPTALLEYSRTIKQKALDLISSRRGKSRSSSSNSSSNSSSLPRSTADGDSNGVDRSELRETSNADLFLGSHLVPFLIELGISWLFAERRYNVEPSISVDTPSTAVHPEAEVVAAVDASQAESDHYAGTSYDDDDPSRSKTHGLLLSKKASAASAVTSEVLRECVEGNAYRYLAMEALELEYGASTVGRVICQPTTDDVATTTPLHKEDGFGRGGGGGADAVRHWMCSRGLTLSLVVIIIRDLLCCEYQFFTTAVVITMFCRNRCFQEDVLSLLLQMYADEDILNYDERDDGSSSRHSQTIIDSDSTRGGRYSADEKLRRILHVFGLTNIIRRKRMMMKGEDEHSSLQQVEGTSVQLLLLRAVSPQYIRRVVVEAAAHTHTSSHGGAGAMSTGGGYFELMPLSDHHHHHHPLHADLASAAALEPSSSYSLLSLLKSLVLALLLVHDRDTASLLLRTISIYITAKVDPSLHLALSMDGEEHSSNEAILRALL